MEKIPFAGLVLSFQPRIRLLRSFDQASHSCLGYALVVSDTEREGNISLGIGVGE